MSQDNQPEPEVREMTFDYALGFVDGFVNNQVLVTNAPADVETVDMVIGLYTSVFNILKGKDNVRANMVSKWIASYKKYRKDLQDAWSQHDMREERTIN